ncbi:unnamed protein product [Arabis nemorensis]|uniref:Uncharacterized protein n=1 Tax=Arabis nemorensis TaxID=586526 RepID=A0A565AUL7_9BRAS|nr:unnamed protein product [Arabis nemorensis]
MADFGYLSGKDDTAAVDDLLSQAKDLYVLEQVAAINCSSFTDSSLPTNLETRFRRLKSLPVSSSSKKKLLLSHSKTMASSRSAFPGHEKQNFSGNLLGIPSVNSGFEKDFTDSEKIGSSFSRESIEPNLSVNSTTTMKLLLPKEKSRISSSSFTSIDLSSPSSNLDAEKSKSKSKFSVSWFGKLSSSPSKAMGGCLWCTPSRSSSNSNKTKKSSKSPEELRAEEHRNKMKIAMKESKGEVNRLVRRSKCVRGPFWFLLC